MPKDNRTFDQPLRLPLPARPVPKRIFVPKKGNWNIRCPAFFVGLGKHRAESQGYCCGCQQSSCSGLLHARSWRCCSSYHHDSRGKFPCISQKSNIHAFFCKVLSPSITFYVIQSCPQSIGSFLQFRVIHCIGSKFFFIPFHPYANSFFRRSAHP